MARGPTAAASVAARPWLLAIRRWVSHPAFVPSLLFVVAFLVRLPLLRVPIYGDEAGMFYFSRHPLQDAQNVHALDSSEPYPSGVFFWWRPLYRLAFLPAALVSFDAYRIFNFAVCAALPSVIVLLFRAYAARASVTILAGAAATFYPTLVHWSEIVFPDAPMTTAFVAGLWLAERGRAFWAGVSFTSAVWVKETAAVGVLVLLAFTFARATRARRASIWPLRLDPLGSACAYALVLGAAPLFVYLWLGGVKPGWTPGVNGPELLDVLLPSLWFGPVIVAGLAFRRTRLIAAITLSYVAFYLLWTWHLGQWVQDWYQVQPVALGLIAAFLVVDELVRRRGERKARRVPAAIPAMALILVAGLVLLQVVAPSSWEVKGRITNPVGGVSGWGVRELYVRDFYFDARVDLMEHLGAQRYGTVVAIDFPWFFLLYPFSERADEVRWMMAGWEFSRVEEVAKWTALIEGPGHVTLIHKPETIHAANQAVRNVYAGCQSYENDGYAVVHGDRCAGSLDRLVEEYERLSGRRLA